MKNLLSQVKQCRLCEKILPLEPNPILQISTQSKILIVGQAPGIKAHQKSMPFDDKSGDRLRAWLGVNKSQFYNEQLFAILPMGFCYPGRGKSGDLPPIPQCATTWRKALLEKLTEIELTIILGKYAVEWHLHSKAPITKLAKQWQTLLPLNKIVLPHPSPRNNLWLKKNLWFEKEVIPLLQKKVTALMPD
ncbi:uracil-DNA glycosylase family protein [Colwellia sp. MSW7]|uniref:Uracil-DNA glycosylase family protein n=1 Tax=Colwellia maritima TaxID=2912588 RepID=A0ABS9X402_9GAMM|nr:uracil-DNA glycosylase family protein [Colwellia maritima]MCI2283787.1 uracil-DNA glycosylase family protein [Colwellia maritima]